MKINLWCVAAFMFAIFLITGLAIAANDKDQIVEKKINIDKEIIVNKTKETSKAIASGIKINDEASEIPKYIYTKEKDKIIVSKPEVENKTTGKMEHTKTVLTIDEKIAKTIDVDKDNKFSVSRWVDGQFVSSKIVASQQLKTGV